MLIFFAKNARPKMGGAIFLFFVFRVPICIRNGCFFQFFFLPLIIAYQAKNSLIGSVWEIERDEESGRERGTMASWYGSLPFSSENDEHSFHFHFFELNSFFPANSNGSFKTKRNFFVFFGQPLN